MALLPGERIFALEVCAKYHTLPLYTSNKLTLPKVQTPKDKLASLDVLQMSVGTDPGFGVGDAHGNRILQAFA